MRLHRSVSVALLVFVLLAFATVIVKDVRRSQRARALSAGLQQQATASAAIQEPTTRPDENPVAGPTKDPGTAAMLPAPPAPTATAHAAAVPAQPPPLTAQAERVVRVTYFYTATRCTSCYKIEALSEAVVSSNFAAALAKGDLVWRTINVDEPGNEHYIDDYRLFTKSVIVSEVVDGKEVRFKNLDLVWKLLGDESTFARYVATEVGAFLEHS